ncbi:spore germination protein [Brevibacillus ruminantium]|uniref:Spore germination protein n=1 Tax=Brevibacillus ruminantium TaxID=2950604 RepID=A0ABY4WPP6_9BACL|nr:GerAB/ArcD/ProY family transporter [Brevibacillus ruminantium]USG68057.1 spore germination protein [Brevibacillus ruminantium]
MGSLPIPFISTYHLTITFVSTIIGVGILTLPRVAGEKLGTPDVWIEVILSGIISFLAVCICLYLSNRFPQETLYHYNKRIVGKILGAVISLLYIVHYLFYSAYEARVQAEAVRHYLLDQTPIEVTILAFLLVGVYLTTGGLPAIVRISVFYFPITLVIIFSIVLLNWQNFKLDNLRPVMEFGPLPLASSLLSTSQAFSGVEVVLFFLAYTKEARKALRPLLLGTALVTLIYMITVMMVIGSLTLEETKTLTWPTMEFVKQIEFPGAFFEHFEIFFISIWLLNMFTTFFVDLYLASFGISLLFGWNIRPVMLGLVPVLYVIASLPKDLNEVMRLSNLLGTTSVFASLVIPGVLLFLSVLLGKRNDNSRMAKAGKEG